jgi:small conductance mechanosensitive channel
MPYDVTQLGNLLVVYGLNCLGGIVIGLAGWWTAGLTERMTRRALMAAPHMDPTVGTFLSSLAYYSVLAVTFVLILQVIGIPATSLVAVLGAASLAIGLALQGTLSNMAAGVMLLLFRPFRIGDTIEVGGKSGTVKSLNLFITELASGDNVQVLIPNGQVWGAAITNLSTYPTRRVSVNFPVPFDKNLEMISSELRARLAQDPRILEAPPPTVRLANLTDKGVECSIEAWTKAADAGAVRADFVQQALATVQPPPAQIH